MKNCSHIALGLVLSIVLSGCAKREPESEPIRAVRTMTVALGSAGATKEYAAEVRARTETHLSFRVGGKLVRRMVETGQFVKAGQAIAQLDPADLKQSQEVAEAALAAAQANIDLLVGEYRRFKELREQGFISAGELERREAALKAARAQLDQAKAQAAVQRNQASYATLISASAGVITRVDAEPGAVVAAGAPIVRLALDGPRDVVFSVPEDSLPMFRALLGKANAVNVRVWGDVGVHPATLRELAPSADPATRTYLAKADLALVKVQLGQTATVLVDVARVEGIVKLPLSTLVRSGEKSAVWVVDKPSMSVRLVPVILGGADGNEIVVAQGLSPGQEVVIAGVHVLTERQKVRFFDATLPTVTSAASGSAAGAASAPR